MMNVNIETEDKQQFPMEILYSDTVLEIKRKIEKHQSYPVSTQTLVFKEQTLEDEGHPQLYGIIHGSTIQLTINQEEPLIIDAPPASKNPRSEGWLLSINMLLSEKNFSFLVDRMDNVAKLKKMIRWQAGISLSKSVFLYARGEEMQDDILLAVYELTDDTVVRAVTTYKESMMRVRLSVRAPDSNRQFSVAVQTQDKVAQLKEKIQESQGISSNRLVLSMGDGNEMQDQHALAHYGVTNNTKVILVIKADKRIQVSINVPILKKRFVLGADLEDTVAKLKERIQFNIGIPSSKSVLFIEINEMKDDQALVHYGVTNNSEMSLAIVPSATVLLSISVPASRKQFLLDIDSSYNVAQLKDRIPEKSRIPPNMFRLFMVVPEPAPAKHKLMQDPCVLAEYGVADGTEVIVSMNVKVTVMSACGTKKSDLLVNPCATVREFRKELHGTLSFPLPDEFYFVTA